MVGSKGGPGGVNQTRPLLKTGGQQALLSVEVLKNCLDELQNWENIAPNKMAPNARKRLGHVCQDMAAGLSGVDQCTGMLYAAEKIVRENMTPGRTLDGSCNLLSALEACDKCDDSRCVFYYCRTYYKAVRVGGGRSRVSGDQSREGGVPLWVRSVLVFAHSRLEMSQFLCQQTGVV